LEPLTAQHALFHEAMIPAAECCLGKVLGDIDNSGPNLRLRLGEPDGRPVDYAWPTRSSLQGREPGGILLSLAALLGPPDPQQEDRDDDRRDDLVGEHDSISVLVKKRPQ
jgi:hypothetical protein